MADGTLIKDMALTAELNDDDDLIVEDSTPTTKRVKYSDLKEATVSNVRGSIGDAFDETATYAAGDYCIYENTLYQFTADHAAGEWLGTDAEATTVAAELSELNGNLSENWSYIDCDIYPEAGTDGIQSSFDALKNANEVLFVTTNSDADIDSTSSATTFYLMTPIKNYPYHICEYFINGSISDYAWGIDVYFTPKSGYVWFRNLFIGSATTRKAIRRIYYR